jgi:hypothetical protein
MPAHLRRRPPRPAWAALLSLLAFLALLAPARAQGPTAIDVQYFRANLQGNSVLLEWRTGTEIDTGGFQVWRSEISNDPGRGVLVEDFPPQGDTAGFTYQYTDTGVLPGRTYYYTLVAYDLSGNESPFPSDPPAITIGQAQPQSTPTFTPTQPVATQPAATATPTTVSGLQPVTPGASGAFVTSTPTFTPFPNQATVQPALPAADTPLPPAVVPAAVTPGVIAEATPAPLPPAAVPAAGPGAPATVPAQPPPAAELVPAATPVVLAQAPAAPSPELAPRVVLPTRGPRPTPPPALPVTRPQAILGVIALGSVVTALLIAGLMVLLWLRWRSGG